MEKQIVKVRKNWIDWMKAVCMIIVVWGHCFPPLSSDFIYTFNVAVFFVLSGFLCKREESSGVFWRKLWHRLALPYLILALLKIAGYVLKHLSDGNGLLSLLAILTGFHSFDEVHGCNNLWFVYTLIIIKIIYQYAIKDWKAGTVWFLVMSVGAIMFQKAEVELRWAVANVMVAMPFFLFGRMLSAYFMDKVDLLVNSLRNLSVVYKVLAVMLLCAITYAVSVFNGDVSMFQGLHGNNYALFLLGGVAGTVLIFAICSYLDSIRSTIVGYISIGTMVILTFHRDVNHPLLKLIGKQEFNDVTREVLLLPTAVITVLVFVPIVILLRRYCPVILGGRGL